MRFPASQPAAPTRQSVLCALKNTTGNYNTAIGASALSSNQGNNNTATGMDALVATEPVSPTRPTVLRRSLKTQPATITRPTVFGAPFNTTASDNTATGNTRSFGTPPATLTPLRDHALFRNTNGFGNTATGVRALSSNTRRPTRPMVLTHSLPTPSASITRPPGAKALNSNTTGVNNTATGDNALFSNTTGAQQHGHRCLIALNSNTTGNYNTANGVRRSLAIQPGSNNTANGNSALYSNTTGNENTATGVDRAQWQHDRPAITRLPVLRHTLIQHNRQRQHGQRF